MTFSIVACDLEEESWGVAVASKFPAVGAVVPFAQAKAGAVATQSFANTSFGPRGLELMATGLSAQKALDQLLVDDPDRQLDRLAWLIARVVQLPSPATSVFHGLVVSQAMAMPFRATFLPAQKLSQRWKRHF